MNVAVFTSTNFSFNAMKAIHKSGDSIELVVLPKNRENSNKINETITYLQKNKIEWVFHDRKEEKPLIDMLNKLSVEIGVSWSYSQLISKELIQCFPKGIVNMHGGLLPKYRGANVLNWAIINGESETGVTLHYIDEKIDTGSIIAQKSVPILLDDTALTLREKIEKCAANLFEDTWDGIKTNRVNGIPQDENRSRYYRARKPSDGEIIWDSMTSKQIYDLIRGLVKPWPGAYFLHRGEKILVFNSEIINKDFPKGKLPGEILDVAKEEIIVVTRDGMISLKSLETEDGKSLGNLLDKFTNYN